MKRRRGRPIEPSVAFAKTFPGEWCMKVLTAIPVYNEERHVEGVLDEVRRFSPNILVINDGSTDRTGELRARRTDVEVVTHSRNRGYGAALVTAFEHARKQEIDVLVTMDCDGQHE